LDQPTLASKSTIPTTISTVQPAEAAAHVKRWRGAGGAS